MKWRILLCVTVLVSPAIPAYAQADLPMREQALAAQLRCVVCQNQTVAESQAPMAADMRREIRLQLEQGRSDAEVVKFFEQRYGAFVRYKPPLQASTWLLWSAPFVIAVGGLVLLWRSLRRRNARAQALSAAQHQQLQQWLESEQCAKGPLP